MCVWFPQHNARLEFVEKVRSDVVNHTLAFCEQRTQSYGKTVQACVDLPFLNLCARFKYIHTLLSVSGVFPGQGEVFRGCGFKKCRHESSQDIILLSLTCLWIMEIVHSRQDELEKTH